MRFETVHVECVSGYRANERPIAFTWRGYRHEIAVVTDRWYEGHVRAKDPVIDYFKVTTTEGDEFILRYNRTFDGWGICVPAGMSP